MFGVRLILITLLVLVFTAACNSSPTVPVPPPQATLIETTIPDTDGFVTVEGAPDPNYGLEDVALVFNDNTGGGAMTDVQSNGAWQTRIAAQVNHVLIIQILRGDRVSEGAEVVVGEENP